MKHGQSDPLPLAAAKAGVSRATAYRLLKDGRLP
jgi:predicted DNA-binding transcriptional regulator AlpA